MTDEMLLKEAKKARECSYSPYSNFQVGAALLTKGGKVYLGCNIENASYTPTNCAERTAFFKAICDGEREFTKIAVVGGKKGEEAKQICTPCGVCRQVMMEFCNPETFQIVLSDGNDGCQSYLLKELLPMGFGPNDLK